MEASQQLEHVLLSAASSPFIHWAYPEMRGMDERTHLLYSDQRNSHIGWHKHPSKTNTILPNWREEVGRQVETSKKNRIFHWVRKLWPGFCFTSNFIFRALSLHEVENNGHERPFQPQGETYYKLVPYITKSLTGICFLNFETQSNCDSLSLCWHEPWAS